MKLFRRRPKPVHPAAALAEQMDRNPGEWFEYPTNTLMLSREAFLRYDVRGDAATGSVQIRRKPVQ